MKNNKMTVSRGFLLKEEHWAAREMVREIQEGDDGGAEFYRGQFVALRRVRLTFCEAFKPLEAVCRAHDVSTRLYWLAVSRLPSLDRGEGAAQ